MKCECCNVEVDENDKEKHDESITHRYNEYNFLKELVENNDNNADQEEIFDYRRLKKFFEETHTFNCGKSFFDDANCHCHAGSLADVIQQERLCYKEFNKEKIIDKNIEEKPEPFKFIACDLCGKKFYDKGQKLKPIYALNNHRKTCKQVQTKKQIAYILDHFKTFRYVRSDGERDYVKQIYDMVKQYDDC